MREGRVPPSTPFSTEIFLEVKGPEEMIEQFRETAERRKLWKFGDHIIWGVKKEPSIGTSQHGGVVVRISRCGNSVVQSFESFHSVSLLIDLSKLKINNAIVLNDQPMT